MTASVPLKDEIRCWIVVSILFLRLSLSATVVMTLSQANNKTSRARGCDAAISVRGLKSSTATKTWAPSGRLTRLTRVSSASRVESFELSFC